MNFEPFAPLCEAVFGVSYTDCQLRDEVEYSCRDHFFTTIEVFAPELFIKFVDQLLADEALDAASRAALDKYASLHKEGKRPSYAMASLTSDEVDLFVDTIRSNSDAFESMAAEMRDKLVQEMRSVALRRVPRDECWKLLNLFTDYEWPKDRIKREIESNPETVWINCGLQGLYDELRKRVTVDSVFNSLDYSDRGCL